MTTTRRSKSKRKSTRTAKRPPAPAATASVVPAEYRERYQDGSCGDDLAQRLRRHTASSDGTTDIAKLKALAQANGLVLSKLATRTGYIDCLLINWACVPIELALECAGIYEVLRDWGRRRRRGVLAADLKALDAQSPSYPALTIDSDIGSLLGWSYVLEGSRLGARVILQAVLSSPATEVRDAIAFLQHGEGEPLWQTFKAELEKINGDPEAVAKACAGAKAAALRPTTAYGAS
jgi:heme oxygenase